MEYRSKYSNINRIHWNEKAPIHQKKYVDELLQLVGKKDFTTFDLVEKRLFQEIKLFNKSVAQINCNNARELISVKKAGAGRCVGIDISDQFIQQARQLAQAANVEIELVCSDIYELGDIYDNQFDLLYITIGVLGWLEDLDAFFDILKNLLRPGGQIFIYEMHPILQLFDEDSGGEIVHDYFSHEPWFEENEKDYMDHSAIIKSPSYWFHHPMSEILENVINHGFNITHFDEYAHDISGGGEFLSKKENRPPMCFSLIANLDEK
jgi:ubiquinone/menaquinone biosynthesis C-methylase UbiE